VQLVLEGLERRWLPTALTGITEYPVPTAAKRGLCREVVCC
jgi:hypothetical protein